MHVVMVRGEQSTPTDQEQPEVFNADADQKFSMLLDVVHRGLRVNRPFAAGNSDYFCIRGLPQICWRLGGNVCTLSRHFTFV